MNKNSKSDDKKIIKNYLKMKYPSFTHQLDLDLTFDYIAGLASTFLENHNNLNFRIIDFPEKEKNNIKNTILKYNNKETDYLNHFYQKTLEIIKILRKYYNDDGTKK